MSSVLIAIGNTEESSVVITLADGEVANLVATIPDTYNGPEDDAVAYVQWRKADNSFVDIGRIGTAFSLRTVKLADAGDYRVLRRAQTNAMGVERG